MPKDPIDWRIRDVDGEVFPDFELHEYRRDLPDLPPQMDQAVLDANKIPPWRGALQGLQVNQRGASDTINVGEKKTIAEVRSKSEDADVISVCIGKTLEQFATGNFVVLPRIEANIKARIFWGMGSANFEAVVDVNEGTTFQIPANFIRVQAEYLPTTLVTPPPAIVNPIVRLNVGFAYGASPQMCSPARFTDSQVVTAGGLAAFQIPPFAKSFTIVANDPAATADVVVGAILIDYATFSLVTPHSNADAQTENQFPIPNAATLIVLSNTGPNDAIFSIIYSLGF